MLKAVCGQNGELTCQGSIDGFPVYLDNFAVSFLARKSNPLRQRFLAALQNGADLLFSIANGIEISGAQGESALAIKAFLDDCGPHWYPVELSPDVVIDREQAGVEPSRCFFAEELLNAFFRNRTAGYTPGSGKVIDLSADFFKLGMFVDWLEPERDYFLQQCRAFDDMLITSVGNLRAKHKKNPGWLDRTMPAPIFNPRMPAWFARNCLLRGLISDFGFQVKKGDGMDFCHAVMASSFGTFASLDIQWKRRVDNFPKPNKSARIYHRNELEKMMTDIEYALDRFKRGVSPIIIPA